MIDEKLLNGAALAFIGDGVYDLFIRQHVLEEGVTHPHLLTKMAVRYVSAQAQAKIMRYWLHEANFLSEEELGYYKRGRNYKGNSKAKNASIGDYRQATGFEALMGWLYLSGQSDRLQILCMSAIQIIEEEA